MTIDDSGTGSEAGPPRPDHGFLKPGEARLVRLACPDCGGALAQVDLPQISYFRCHVGHQYGPETLVAALSDSSESRLWSAVAALEEEAMLHSYVEEHLAERPQPPSGAGLLSRRSEDLWARAAELRGHALRWTGSEPPSRESSKDQSPLDEPS